MNAITKPTRRRSKTITRAHMLYSKIANMYSEKGYAPSMREIIDVIPWISSTSTARYYLLVLQDLGLIEFNGGISRGIQIVDAELNIPRGIHGRDSDEYSPEELKRAIHEAGEALLSLYNGMDRRRHWEHRMDHPVEISELAREVKDGVAKGWLGPNPVITRREAMDHVD